MKKYNEDNAITQIRKGSQFDENMKKYNEDNVNYENSKRPVFEVGIM